MFFLRTIEIVPTGGVVGLFVWLTILATFIVMEIYYKLEEKKDLRNNKEQIEKMKQDLDSAREYANRKEGKRK